MPTIRRRTVRQKSLLTGKLYFNNRLQVVDCTIRDFSELGCRLTHSDAITTPDNLELYIPQRDQTLNVHVVWRRGQEVGVEFDRAPPSAQTDLHSRVARLAEEIEALKRLLQKV